jgi:hypothetical protein
MTYCKKKYRNLPDTELDRLVKRYKSYNITEKDKIVKYITENFPSSLNRFELKLKHGFTCKTKKV